MDKHFVLQKIGKKDGKRTIVAHTTIDEQGGVAATVSRPLHGYTIKTHTIPSLN